MKTSPQFAGPKDSQELSAVRFSEPSLAVPSRSPRSAPCPPVLKPRALRLILCLICSSFC